MRFGWLGSGPGHERGDPLGDDPVDHAGILSSILRVSFDRAAMTGEAGSAVRGALSGSSHHGKLTWPPASRTISWPAAASTPRERRSETIPSKRAAATWQSEAAIVPSARSR